MEAALQTAMKVAPSFGEHLTRSRLNPRWYRWAHAKTEAQWIEHGERQLTFLIDAGLKPYHNFLDVGCGPLRAGLHFVGYLEPGHYCGIDMSSVFLRAGERELEMAGLADKGATLIRNDSFQFDRFDRSFDFALAQSVFTHMPFNRIVRCLSNIEEALRPGGKFYATFMPNLGPRLRRDSFWREGQLWHLDRDPYYYDPQNFTWAVEGSSLSYEYLGEWGHHGGQEMGVFSKAL